MLRMETNSNLRPSGPGSISDDDLEDLFHLDFSSDIYRQIPSSNLDILAEELDIYNGSNTSDPSPGMGLTTTLNVDQSLPYPGKEKGQVAALISGPSYSYQSEALGLPKSTNPSLSYLSDTMGIATTSNTNSSVSYMLDTMNLPATSNASSISSYLSETPKLETKSSNPIEKIMESTSSSLPSVNMDLPEISNPGSSFSNSSLDSELSETSNTNPDHSLSYSSFNIKPPKNSSTVGSCSPYPSVDFVSSSASSTDPSLPYSSVNTGLINTSVGIPSTFSLLKNSYAINHFDTGQNLRDINYTNTNYLGTHVEPKNLAESWNPHLSGVFDEDEEVFSSSLEALNLLNPGILNNYNKEIFGTIKSEIINVSMFKAKVLDNETVFLRKAPDMFDRFTIRVDNRSMDQIGVIKRDHSSALAYIIDNNLASVEGKVHYNADCIFRIPVEIKLSGESSKKAEVLRHFKRYGISVIPHYDSLGHMPEHESPLPFDYDYDHVISSRTFVTPAEMENQLDEMFKTLDEGDKVTEAKAALAVKTSLYPHQKQALNWMICKENNDLLPPFWEKRGTLYLNTLTRKKTAEKPKSIYGGILADDMGLGKTLEMISLIVTNFVNGQPLAEPLPGFYRESFVKSSRTAQVRLRSENVNDSRGSPESGSNSFINSPPAPRLNLSVLNNMNKEMEETEASPLSSEMVSNSSSSFSPSRGIKRSNYDATDDESIESIFGQGKGKGIGKKSKYNDMNIWESGTDRRPDVASDFVDLTLPETDKQSILTDSSSGLNISNGFTSSSMSYDQMMALSTNTLRNLAYAAARSEPIGFQFIEAAKTTHISNTLDSVIDVDALPESNTYEDITPVDSPDVIEVHEGSQDFKFNTIDSNLVRNHQDYITRPSASKLDFFASRSSSQKLDTIVISDSEDELPDIIMPLNMKKEKINIKDDLPDIIHPLDLTKRKNIGFTEMKKSEVNYFRREPDLIDEIIPWKKRVVTSSTDPQTGRTITDGPRGTLIICPLSVISNWVEQFDEHVDKSVKILLHVYYGPKRTTDVAFLLEQDVIITTYATLSSDFKKGYASPLHQIEWLRIVLDEGHTIRNPAAQQTKAIFELQADRKWILSGTPIQNSLKDLWSLINFLQVKPFTEKKTWNRIIAGPLVKRERQALKRVAHLVRNLAMRRTKNQQLNGKPIVSLPARHVYLETVSLSREERVYYDAMQTNGRDIIGSYYRKGTLLNNYGTVLTILLRLRQLCCHPQLVAMAASKKNPDAVFQDIVGEDPKQPNEHKEKLIKQLKSVLESGSDEECSICLESLKEPVITACAHFYCKLCIEAVIEKNEEASCPMCRAPLDKKELYGVQDGMDDKDGMDNDQFHFNPNEYYSSSKVDALMKALNQLRQEDPRIKSVVVSQFTSLLTLLETPLKEQGFNFVRLDGTMRANDRSQAVRDFSDPSLDSPTIFLLSLKAGGVGINLTAASRVFLLDPAWNPAAEDQCFDRCHRLGQTKDVVITKFVIEDSVEKRMLELQEKKRQLINGVLDKKLSADQRRKIRIDEIKTLFNI